MAVFRIEKTKDYTVMSNHHLRDRKLSLKGKGLLSLMLSLPEDWDYTLAGLATICHDGIGSVRSGIAELEERGYLTRRRIREANGQLGDIEYTILEVPRKGADVDNSPPMCNFPTSEKPICENPTLAKPTFGEHTQSITNKSSIQESNTDLLNIHPSIPPGQASYPQPRRGEPSADRMDGMDSIAIYREIIKENIEYDCLCERYPYSVDEISEIVELMLESVCSARKTIRIGYVLGWNKDARRKAICWYLACVPAVKRISGKAGICLLKRAGRK